MVNWEINVYDLLAIIAAGMLIYGRVVKLETKVTILWGEFTDRRIVGLDRLDRRSDLTDRRKPEG